jgi:hypothetical protein
MRITVYGKGSLGGDLADRWEGGGLCAQARP